MKILMFFFVLASYAAPSDVYTNNTLGISITKPADWFFLSKQELTDNRGRAKIDDETLKANIKKMEAQPLVVFTKHHEPYDKVNPAVSVIVHEANLASGYTDVQVLQNYVEILKQKGRDFSLLKAPASTKLGGQPGAYAKMQYTIETPTGQKFLQISRYWMILKGQELIQILASSPAEGPDSADSQFDQILQSVKL